MVILNNAGALGGDDPPPDSSGDAANTLTLIVESVAEQHEMIASIHARVFVMVANAVQIALRNDRIFVRRSTETRAAREDSTRRALISEFAVALRLSERKVASMVETSERLIHELPETLSALNEGMISVRHAETIVAQSTGLDAAERREFESTAITAAMETTPPQFRNAAAEIREELNAESAAARKAEALDNRHIEVAPMPDGMGWLSIYGPVEMLLGVEAAARNTARSLKSAGDERTVAQIACDAIVDAMMTGFTEGVSSGADSDDETLTGGGHSAPVAARLRPTVNVTVPAMTLLGRSDEPGTLDGYGPIDAETARELAAQAPSFTRLLTHPETGTVLSVGRDSYAVPADLRRLVEIRDRTCGFAGCNRPARRCDIDHIRDWQYGGETSDVNLNSLCRAHHVVKHATTWQVARTDDGTIIWTSPLGRHYLVRPNGRPGYKRAVRFDAAEPERASARQSSSPAHRETSGRSDLPEQPPF